MSLAVSSSFQVVIEGTVGSSYYSDIAIDDVAFSSGCTKFTGGLVTSQAGVTTPSTTVTPCGVGFFQ